MREFLAAILLFLITQSRAAETPIHGIAWPALSPDGGTLAFEWLNDIWLAPSGGGEAIRVVDDAARDAYPKFGPDGKRIYFTSERTGSAQIHSVKADGSNARIHSHHSEGNTLEAISPDGTYAIARGLRECSGYKASRLLKIDLRSDSRELVLFDATAHSVSVSPDGGRFLFCRGGEQLYRKGYRGSRASSIHSFDAAGGNFDVMVSEEVEARSPIWKADGKGFYYVSERDGTFNIWSGGIPGKPDRQLTFLKGDGVVLPAISADGKVMVFRAGSRVFRFAPEGSDPPVVLEFFTNEKPPNRSVRKERVTGTLAATFSESGDRIVFSSAGELWTMDDGEGAVPVRLTETDELDEREPVLSRDGKHLYFLRDDGCGMDVCEADWDDGKMGEPRPVHTGFISKRTLRISPDGRWLSWIESTGNLMTAPTAGGDARMVMAGWDTPTYDWSPDGDWLVAAAKDIHSNRDIFLVRADGSLPPFNLTTHPDFDGSPKFSPDGKSIVFTSRRGTDGLSRLWLIDCAKLAAGDLAAVAASVRPLDTEIREPIRVTWSADSRAVLYQSRDAGDAAIYAIPIDGGKVSDFAEFRGIPEGFAADGSSFWRMDRVPTVFRSGKLTEFRFSLLVEQEREKRLRLGFRRIWRTLSERFYDSTMNATDWPAMLGKYEDAAARARDSRQFDRVVAQLIGELNASHLTFKTKPWGVPSEETAPSKPTAYPGLSFGESWDGPLVVRKVLEGSPISRVDGAPLAGDTVLRIAGKDVDAKTPLRGIFDGAKGIPIPIVVSSPGGKPRTLELVPISYARAQLLDQEAKVRKAELAAASGKQRIAYLPFRKMKSDDLRELSTEVYRASLDSEGLVLDLRDNAGGRVADELLGLFCQPKHTFTVPRGGERGYPTDRRVSPSWDGAMVVLCNENTFSNAEIFCHAFKLLGRGKLIGMPTNGGVISAVGVSIPEVGELQIPFRGWFHAETGRDLELNGAVPDLIVPIRPEDQVKGNDPQLDAAMEAIRAAISAKPKVVEPILKSTR